MTETNESIFHLQAPFAPTGDQPQAIEALTRGVLAGDKGQTLLGVTGSGKTFTMANIIALALAALTGFGERWSILPLLFVLLGSYGFMQGNTMAGALNVDPRRAGSVSALMGGASFGVGALAASLSGAFHDGTPRPMAVVMALAVIGSALALRTLALPKAAQS